MMARYERRENLNGARAISTNCGGAGMASPPGDDTAIGIMINPH